MCSVMDGINSDENGLSLSIKKDSRKSKKRPCKKKIPLKRSQFKKQQTRKDEVQGKMNLDNGGGDPEDMDAQDKIAELIAKREEEVSNMPDGSDSDLTLDLQ